VRYRQVGISGLTVSIVGLGGSNFGGRCDQAQTNAVVDAADDVAINFIDTADIYNAGGSENMLGEALKGRRSKFVLATKFGLRGPPSNARGSRRNVRQAVDGSLVRLQTDYLDLYYLHTPDPMTPIGETLAAMHELVVEGKVRYIGACQMTAWQLVESEWTAQSRGQSRFIACQNHYNLINRDIEAEVVPACLKYGVGLIPFFPLAEGLLTGKYRRGQAPPGGTRLAYRQEALTGLAFSRIEALELYAEERGLSLLQVAIGGLAGQPAVASVIAGATSPEQVRANAAAGDWVPSADDMAALSVVTGVPGK
jgi:aryl-alcohol dehydrogenase-like predicted oxidoreductase